MASRVRYVCFDLPPPAVGGMSPLELTFNRFSSGEVEFRLEENISDQLVVVLYRFSEGLLNEDITRLQLLLELLRRNGARVRLFAPFLPYSRQDSNSRQNSAGMRIIAAFARAFRIEKVITYDLHDPKISSFFEEAINLSMIPFFLKRIKALYPKEETVICLPDLGAVHRFGKYVEDEGLNFVYGQKSRTMNGVKIDICGEVARKRVIVVDDMIDTGETLLKMSEAIMKHGGRRVHAYATHGLFSGDAITRIHNSEIENVSISNSINIRQKSERLQIIPVAYDRLLD